MLSVHTTFSVDKKSQTLTWMQEQIHLLEVCALLDREFCGHQVTDVTPHLQEELDDIEVCCPCKHGESKVLHPDNPADTARRVGQISCKTLCLSSYNSATPKVNRVFSCKQLASFIALEDADAALEDANSAYIAAAMHTPPDSDDSEE